MSPMSSKLLHKGLALLCVAAVHSGCGVQHAVTSRTDGGSIDLGYGTAKRGSNAFSVSEVQISEAEENVYDDIFGYLRDHVPGVEVSPDAGAGGVPHVQVRGVRSIFGEDGEPLFLVDGVEFPQIETLRPDQVHSVRVLKDAAASAYGSRGANGVILITTKVAHEAAERERENKQNR